MDRETLAQAVAMLVVLSLLMRWLPPGAPDDPLGRGDPWRYVSIDRALIADPSASEQLGASLRAQFRKEQAQRWRRLLQHVRQLQAVADGRDVVHVRGLSRNELQPLAYDLYPARVVGRSLEEGAGPDEAVRPDATWVLTARGQAEPVVLQPGPAAEAGAEPPR